MYPFFDDNTLRMDISGGDTYIIKRGGDAEVVSMPWSIVDDYVKSELPVEVIGWRAMYDCLIQRSEILKSYYPLDKQEK